MTKTDEIFELKTHHEKMMSPFIIEIIIHYHWNTEDAPMLLESPATMEATEWLCSNGILKKNPEGDKSKYTPNREAIQVYIEKLLAIPLPTLKWVI